MLERRVRRGPLTAGKLEEPARREQLDLCRGDTHQLRAGQRLLDRRSSLLVEPEMSVHERDDGEDDDDLDEGEAWKEGLQE